MNQGTGTPKVSAHISSGNLLRKLSVTDGVAGVIITARKAENIGRVEKMYSLSDAESKGYTAEGEPFIYRFLYEFYLELGGNTELWLLGVEDTMTMEEMVESTHENGCKKLLTFSKGKINLVGVARHPNKGEEISGGFLDKDVENALLASKSLAEYQQSINRPVRILIEGRIKDATSEDIFEPREAENTYAGVVLGSSRPDGSASLGTALARACKYPAHIKLGNGQNGPLSLTQAYIGKQPIDEINPTELDNLSDAGYILMHTREGSAGYYFGIDNMAGTYDFRFLAHGRIIDKAQRVATAAATPFLETHMRMSREGEINASDAKYLEETIKAQLNTSLVDQVSEVAVLVDIAQDLINTSTLSIEVKVQPLGYLSWIRITLGLTTNTE
ncbi:MAG: hypothetical protein FDW93_00760 [Bergeyella sp.]|nr:hypothetical protein [Bergeyella sp.]